MIITSTKMTQQLCADWCGLQSLPYAALTKGNTCQCGSDAYLLKAAGANACTSPCSGSGRTYCGGSAAMYVRESTVTSSTCKRDLAMGQDLTNEGEEEVEGSLLLPGKRDVRYPRRGAQNRPRAHSLRRFW